MPTFLEYKSHNFGGYMPIGVTVTSATYSELLKNHLNPTIGTKRQQSLILLQHDKMWLHTVHATRATIQDVKFECV